LSKTIPLDIDDKLVKEMLNEMGIINADVLIRSKVNEDQLIDAVIGNRKYINAVIVLNKCDTISDEKAIEIKKKINADVLVSAQNKENLRELKELIFSKLDLIRIYMKEPMKEADMKAPLIIPKYSSIQDVCRKLHREMIKKFKFARVWGKSAKHPGQKLTLKHCLEDEDILEIHLI
jgi:hypothetical protein